MAKKKEGVGMKKEDLKVGMIVRRINNGETGGEQDAIGLRAEVILVPHPNGLDDCRIRFIEGAGMKGREYASRVSELEAVETKTESEGKAPSKEKRMTKVHVAEVVRHGKQFVIPEGIDLDAAIDLLQRKKREEEEVVELRFKVDAFPPDGAIAMAKAMERMFGYAFQEPQPGFFGPKPPAMLMVDVDVDKTIMVPWGNFSLPGIDGQLQTYIERKDERMILGIAGTVKRKHKEVIHELVDLTKKIVKEESIYRGKAVSIRWKNDAGENLSMPMPKFMDLSKVKEDEIVFAQEVDSAITTSLFTPIEHSERCRSLGIPLKRGVLLSGKYGTGKTLVSNITALKASKNGWTFLHCPRAAELADMVKFAQAYQPAVIFCEDIDRVMGGERTIEIDDILNIIDGIESKNTEVMVILTTNHLENISPAMLRPGRLDAIINMLPPDAAAVIRLIRLYAKDLVPAGEDLREVGELMAGHLPAIIRECVERSKLDAIRYAKEGELKVTAKALTEAALSMKNQIDLLKKGAEQKTPHEKLALVLGGAVAKGLDVEFPRTNGNGTH